MIMPSNHPSNEESSSKNLQLHPSSELWPRVRMSQKKLNLSQRCRSIMDFLPGSSAISIRTDITPRLEYSLRDALLCSRYAAFFVTKLSAKLSQRRDLVAVSPTGTGKTLSYLLPVFALLRTPIAAGDHQHEEDLGRGLRALIIAPTNELAHQIHNECMKLAQGRKWRAVLFSKATASTLATKEVRQKTGEPE